MAKPTTPMNRTSPESSFMSKCAFTILVLGLLSGSVRAEVPHVGNTSTPRDGVREITLLQQWHRGHEEDDLIFGAVRKVLDGPDGNLYVLDTQMSQVVVFDNAGQWVRTLSREGEGPGETRRPEDIVFLPDGSLGIAQYINGRIIKMDLSGIPRESLMPPGYDPLEGGAMSSVRRVRSRAGSFVINGARVSPAEDGMVRTQYLVRCDEKAQPIVEYLSSVVPQNIMRDGWNEKRNYFPSHERWDIDNQGRVLVAAERNEYRVTVFNVDGSPAFTFGREAERWKRTAEEKQDLRDAVTVIRDGERMNVEVQVEDHEPAIMALHWRPGGEIWVMPATGRHDQTPGVMQTFDVFSDEGEFLRQVALTCPGDPKEDTLFLLNGNRAALVRGAVQARRSAFGGSRGEEKDVPVHDLIVYKF
jgi:6-bladed beta-propeller